MKKTLKPDYELNKILLGSAKGLREPHPRCIPLTISETSNHH